MNKTWVVVADSSRACIFTLDTPRAPLREFERFDHPQSRMHDKELITDKSGRAFESMGGTRHALEPDVDLKHSEMSKFAKEIAVRIEDARMKDQFGKLVLVAAPAFLGVLRKHLSAHTLQRVTREVNKNLTHYPSAEIRAHLPERI